LLPGGAWELRQQDGLKLEARLDAATTRVGDLVFLVWRTEGRRRHAIIDARALPRGDFRRLVTRLAFDPAVRPASPGPVNMNC
jgi:hypothetical protein